MRFSSVFHLPAVPQQPAAPPREVTPDRRPEPQPAQAAPEKDLPDDLDARVRLVGEWQLGEGY